MISDCGVDFVNYPSFPPQSTSLLLYLSTLSSTSSSSSSANSKSPEKSLEIKKKKKKRSNLSNNYHIKGTSPLISSALPVSLLSSSSPPLSSSSSSILSSSSPSSSFSECFNSHFPTHFSSNFHFVSQFELFILDLCSCLTALKNIGSSSKIAISLLKMTKIESSSNELCMSSSFNSFPDTISTFSPSHSIYNWTKLLRYHKIFICYNQDCNNKSVTQNSLYFAYPTFPSHVINLHFHFLSVMCNSPIIQVF
jgi:hypothetical protein